MLASSRYLVIRAWKLSRVVLLVAVILSLSDCSGATRSPDVGSGSNGSSIAVSGQFLPLAAVAQRMPPSTTGDSLRDIQQDAERHLSTFCAQLWGSDNVWLPTQKQWVYYAEGWTSRGRMDFEAGEFQAQALVENGTDAAAALDPPRTIIYQAIKDTPADMSQHDSTMRYVRSLAATRGVTIDPVPAAPGLDAEPVLAGVIDPDAADRLSKSALTQTPIRGTDGKQRTMLTYRVPFRPGYQHRLAARYA